VEGKDIRLLEDHLEVLFQALPLHWIFKILVKLLSSQFFSFLRASFDLSVLQGYRAGWTASLFWFWKQQTTQGSTSAY